MNKHIIIISLMGIFLFPTVPLKSQGEHGAKSPIEILQALKHGNQEIIEKQQKTFQTLDEIIKTTEQIKTLGKRG